MFRLFRGELKKIFLRPGIFVMTGLLILILALAPQFFTPTKKTDVSSTTIVGETVYERFTYFQESILTEQSSSKYVYQDLEKNKSYIDLFLTNSSVDFVNNLKIRLNNINNKRQTVSGLIQVAQTQEECDAITAKLNEILTLLNELKGLYEQYISYDIPLLLVTEDINTNFTFYINSFINTISNNLSPANAENYGELDKLISTNKFISNITSTINLMKNTTYDAKFAQDLLNTYYTPTAAKLSELYTQTLTFATNPETTDSVSDKNLATIDSLIIKYVATAQNASNIIKYGLLNDLSKGVSDSTLAKYVGDYFKNFNSYQVKETYSKYVYLFKNNKTDADFANVFAFNKSSNKTTNGWDYVYFTLEIMSFLIIAYSVVLGAGMIASEQTNGTLKLLAIRPYKRSKIMASKICATMFFATIFVLVSVAVAIITGLIIYGLNSLPILAVFNANQVFVTSAPVLLLLYVASLLIKIWIFVMLAFAISTLFKSYVGATIVSVMIYFITLIVTFVSAGANWLKYIIFANLDLFKFFGGSFAVQYSANQPLTNLFISPVFTDTSVILTAIIISSMLIILHLITYLVFKHRDIQ